MTPDEVDKIAELLIERIQARKHDFWIDPEQHYLDHKHNREMKLTVEDEMDLRQMIGVYKTSRGMFFKAFVGFAIIGAVVLAGIGVFKDTLK